MEKTFHRCGVSAQCSLWAIKKYFCLFFFAYGCFFFWSSMTDCIYSSRYFNVHPFLQCLPVLYMKSLWELTRPICFFFGTCVQLFSWNYPSMNLKLLLFNVKATDEINVPISSHIKRGIRALMFVQLSKMSTHMKCKAQFFLFFLI